MPSRSICIVANGIFCPFDKPYLFFFLNFLVSQDVFGSSHIFQSAVQASATSPRSPGSFVWRMVFRSEDISVCLVCSLLQGVASRRLPQWTEVGDVCTWLTDTFTQAYTGFTLMPRILIKYHRVVPAFHLSVFVTSFSSSEKETWLLIIYDIFSYLFISNRFNNTHFFNTHFV